MAYNILYRNVNTCPKQRRGTSTHYFLLCLTGPLYCPQSLCNSLHFPVNKRGVHKWNTIWVYPWIVQIIIEHVLYNTGMIQVFVFARGGVFELQVSENVSPFSVRCE